MQAEFLLDYIMGWFKDATDLVSGEFHPTGSEHRPGGAATGSQSSVPGEPSLSPPSSKKAKLN